MMEKQCSVKGPLYGSTYNRFNASVIEMSLFALPNGITKTDCNGMTHAVVEITLLREDSSWLREAASHIL